MVSCSSCFNNISWYLSSNSNALWISIRLGDLNPDIDQEAVKDITMNRTRPLCITLSWRPRNRRSSWRGCWSSNRSRGRMVAEFSTVQNTTRSLRTWIHFNLVFRTKSQNLMPSIGKIRILAVVDAVWRRQARKWGFGPSSWCMLPWWYMDSISSWWCSDLRPQMSLISCSNVMQMLRNPRRGRLALIWRPKVSQAPVFANNSTCKEATNPMPHCNTANNGKTISDIPYNSTAVSSSLWLS